MVRGTLGVFRATKRFRLTVGSSTYRRREPSHHSTRRVQDMKNWNRGFVCRRRGSALMATTRIFGAAVAGVYLAACSADRAVSPEKEITPALSAGVGAGDAARSTQSIPQPADFVRCEIANRSPDGSYRTFVAGFRIEKSLQHGSNNRVRYTLPREAEQPDPSNIVACEIPATPAAEAYFNRVFKAAERSSEKGFSTLPDAPSMPQAVATAMRAYMLEECPPEAVQCDPGSGEWPGPPSSEPDIPAGPVYTSAAVPLCWGNLQDIHRSVHVPGTINVVATTTCPQTQPLGVNVQISRKSCIWFYCWWSGFPSGYQYATSDTFVSANSAGPCKVGTWRATSSHWAIYPGMLIPSWAPNDRVTSYVAWC